MTIEEYREKVLAEIDREIGTFLRGENSATEPSTAREWRDMRIVALGLRHRIAAIPINEPPITDNGDNQP